MNYDFKDKVVLITGSGAGIGRAAALAFARCGAKVIVNSVSEESGKETLELISREGLEGIFARGDVSLDSHVRSVFQKILDSYGRLDIAVNNAGIVVGGSIDEVSEEDWDRTMAVNVKSVYLVSKYAALQMKKQGGGVIVHNSSAVAIKGVVNRAAYTASKGAVLSLTKAMAADYIKDNIRVNCVSPGTIETPSLHGRIAASGNPEQALKDFIARQPMGRLGHADEIAAAILFASSEQTAFMTGANIVVDGGLCI